MQWLNRLKKENQDPCICSLQETHFSVKDAQRLTEGIEKDPSRQMEIKRNLGQLHRKIGVKSRLKQQSYQIKIMGSIQPKNIIFAYIYVPEVGAPNCLMQILTDIGENRQQCKNGGGIQYLCFINKQIIQTEINKKILALNYMLEKMNLRVIYRRFHTKAAEYTFFSSLHVTFSRRDHILGREIF